MILLRCHRVERVLNVTPQCKIKEGPRGDYGDGLRPQRLLLSPDLAASLAVADEVSSYNSPRGILDRLISSVVRLSEDSRVSVVRFAVVELCKGRAICGERRSHRAR